MPVEKNSNHSKEIRKAVKMFEMECMSRDYFTSQGEGKEREPYFCPDTGGVCLFFFILLCSKGRGISRHGENMGFAITEIWV